MEEKGFIEVKIDGKVGDAPLKPDDVDITEVKEVITNIETFLYPGKLEKSDRPRISYKIEEGSVLHYFHLPISAVILFNGLSGEITDRGNIDFLDYKRAQVIEKFQQLALERNLEITFSNSLQSPKKLVINRTTSFFTVAASYIETELTLYGKIEAEGGVNPNFHIETIEYGRLTVSATIEQLLEGEKRLYKHFGIRVTGKQSLTDKKPFDLKLLNYIEYNPVFNKTELDILIERATPNLSKIIDVDAWLNELRGGTYA